jgi:ABC-type multidrug transport system fused ATPase/permease subunit
VKTIKSEVFDMKNLNKKNDIILGVTKLVVAVFAVVAVAVALYVFTTIWALVAFAALSIIAAVSYEIHKYFKELPFDVGIRERYGRIRDANSFDILEEELKAVRKYLEDNKLTEANTKIFVRHKWNEVRFFYDNIGASLKRIEESRGIADGLSELQKNELLKEIRKAAYDDRLPPNLAFYPNQLGYYFADKIIANALACSIGALVAALAAGWMPFFGWLVGITAVLVVLVINLGD